MMSRSWILVVISLGMMGYAIALGPYLGASFFLTSMCWGWMACCGLLGRIAAARAMAMIMTVLVFVALALVVFTSARVDRLAILALGLLPSVVSWGCLAYLTSFLMQEEIDREPAGRDVDRALTYDEFERALRGVPAVSDQDGSASRGGGREAVEALRRRLRDAA